MNFFDLFKSGVSKATEKLSEIAPVKQEEPVPAVAKPIFSYGVGYQRPFGLYLGDSTGILSQRGDNNGVYNGQGIWLDKFALCQNTIVFGGIGAGKTSHCMQPLLQQVMFFFDVGGLIFDIKGDMVKVVDLYAGYVGRNVKHIGTGKDALGVNLIDGLSPEQVSSYLKSVIGSVQGGSGNDPYWINAGIDLIRNTLGLLSHLPSKYYTLEYLYRYIFDKTAQAGLNAKLAGIEKEFDVNTPEGRKFQSYKEYFENVWFPMDDKMRNSVTSVLSPVLQPFTTPEIIDAFSGTENKYDMKNVLAGDMVVVDMPLAKYGIGGKVIYTLIKLRFFNLLQERQYNRELPQNLVMFMCDEYQELISAVGGAGGTLDDRTFWDKSRSAGCFGIVSSQSVEALEAVIGDERVTSAILANFRQKITFRTESAKTIDLFASIIGNYGRMPIVDSALIHTMDSNYALAVLNIDGAAADDVVLMPAYYDDGTGDHLLINNVFGDMSNMYTNRVKEDGHHA